MPPHRPPPAVGSTEQWAGRQARALLPTWRPAPLGAGVRWTQDPVLCLERGSLPAEGRALNPRSLQSAGTVHVDTSRHVFYKGGI